MLLRMLRPTHNSGAHVGKSFMRPMVMAFAIIFVSTKDRRTGPEDHFLS